jgi:aryl-alcohol dehydrogenase-like predicted oxidoreductase
VMTYQSQARGFYAKYAIRDEVPISPALWAQFGSQENINRYDRACQLSNELGVSTNAIALAYILNQRFPTYAIIGSHTMAQLQDSMAAADVLLTQSHVRFLECGHD